MTLDGGPFDGLAKFVDRMPSDAVILHTEGTGIRGGPSLHAITRKAWADPTVPRITLLPLPDRQEIPR